MSGKKAGNAFTNPSSAKIEQQRKILEELEKRKKQLSQGRWLSDHNLTTPGLNTPKTPDIEAMNVETYSQNIYSMNDSLHDLHHVAQQQNQIQQMMQSPSVMSQQQLPRPHPQQQQGQQPGLPIPNPMDPQPFYISQPDSSPQRRTWDQPQPIPFAHQHGPGGLPYWPQQPGRRAQWGVPQHPPQGPPPPVMYNPYSGTPIPVGPPTDQWHNSMGPYNGYEHPQMSSSAYSAYNNPTYGGYNQPYGAYTSPPNPSQQQQQQQPQTQQRPFRLHDDSGASTPLKSPSVTPFRFRAGSSTLPSR